MKGVATLYRWSVTADRQRQFVSHWRTIARELRQAGALGCHLLRGEDGDFIGLIRWPSAYARDRAHRAAETQAMPGVRGLAEARLSVEDDLTSTAPGPLGLAL